MSNVEIVGLIVSIVGIGSFSALFTILYVTYSHATINESISGKKDIAYMTEIIS